MIVNIRDPQTLRQINPTSVSTYLQQKGWHEQQHVEDKVVSWTKKIEDSEELEISVPLDPKFADFHFRISEVLQNLAIVENRLPEEIFDDLVSLTQQKAETSIHISAKEIESTAEIMKAQDLNYALTKFNETFTITIFAIIIPVGLIILMSILQFTDISKGLIVCLLLFLILALSIISLKNLSSIKIEISFPKIPIK
jgi:hypothetical protein